MPQGDARVMEIVHGLRKVWPKKEAGRCNVFQTQYGGAIELGKICIWDDRVQAQGGDVSESETEMVGILKRIVRRSTSRFAVRMWDEARGEKLKGR